MTLLTLACSLMQTKVVALSPARSSMLPRAPRTVLRAAKDDMPPYDGYEDEVAKRRISRDNVGVSFAKPTDIRTARLKQLLQDEDFAAAERESAAALAVLPELADVARMRGRALLSPLLDKLIDGGAVVRRLCEAHAHVIPRDPSLRDLVLVAVVGRQCIISGRA